MPIFDILTPIDNARKKKMDRLRKKLGHHIPVDLVFPGTGVSREHEDSSSSSDESSVDAHTLACASSPVPSRKSKPKIAKARDSVSGSLIVHHAPRNPTNTKATLDSDSLSSNVPPLPSRPPLVQKSSSQDPESTTTRKLVAIIESPDEHGMTGSCTEDFGRARASSRGSNSSDSAQWNRPEAESEIKQWSTRRGYEGWAIPEPTKTARSRRWSFMNTK